MPFVCLSLRHNPLYYFQALNKDAEWWKANTGSTSQNAIEAKWRVEKARRRAQVIVSIRTLAHTRAACVHGGGAGGQVRGEVGGGRGGAPG